MFAVTVLFEIHDGHLGRFMPMMIGNAKASLEQEEGCRRFDVLTDPDRPGEVFLYELYDDQAAFEIHLRTPHFREFDARVAPMVAAKTVRTYTEVTS